MATHRHRAITAKQTERGWTACVTPNACAADSLRQRAHGSLLVVDRCSCGAVRRSEQNQGRLNRGEWARPND